MSGSTSTSIPAPVTSASAQHQWASEKGRTEINHYCCKTEVEIVGKRKNFQAASVTPSPAQRCLHHTTTQHQSKENIAKEIMGEWSGQLLAAPGKGTDTTGRKLWYLGALCLNLSHLFFFFFFNRFPLWWEEGKKQEKVWQRIYTYWCF